MIKNFKDVNEEEPIKLKSKSTLVTILEPTKNNIKFNTKEKSVLINLRIKESIRNKFKEFAEQNGSDMSEILKNFIYDCLNN